MDINLGVTFDGEVEAAQPVPRQRVSTTLKHYSTRLVHLHYFGHDLKTPSAFNRLSGSQNPKASTLRSLY